jgi:hypothetical protein
MPSSKFMTINFNKSAKPVKKNIKNRAATLNKTFLWLFMFLQLFTTIYLQNLWP